MIELMGLRPFAPTTNPHTKDEKDQIVSFSLLLRKKPTYSFDQADYTYHVTVSFHSYDNGGFNTPNIEINYTADPQVIKSAAEFWIKFCKYAEEKNKGVHLDTFLSYLRDKKIPLLYYYNGSFYKNPSQKRFKYFYNKTFQGYLIADSAFDALKKISKNSIWTNEDMKHISVEEVEFTPTEHLLIPDWIKNIEV